MSLRLELIDAKSKRGDGLTPDDESVRPLIEPTLEKIYDEIDRRLKE